MLIAVAIPPPLPDLAGRVYPHLRWSLRVQRKQSVRHYAAQRLTVWTNVHTVCKWRTTRAAAAVARAVGRVAAAVAASALAICHRV